MRILVSVILLLWASLAAAFEVTQEVTPNGHKFSFVHMADTKRVAISMAWVGGYGFVAKDKATIQELGPVMMANGGAGGLSPDEILSQFTAIDSGARLYVNEDALRGFVVAPEKDMMKAAEIANKVLAQPTLDPRWLKRFQRNYSQNMTEGMKTHYGQAWRGFRTLVMGDHPLTTAWNATPVSGIQSISIEDIRDWYDKTLSTDDLLIYAAGNADVTKIAEVIDVALASLKKGHKRTALPPLTMSYPSKTILIHRPEIEKSYILVAGPIAPEYSPNYEAIQLASGVLGVSDQSRLFKAIRKELRAAYGFGAGYHKFSRDHGVLTLNGEVETAKLAEAMRVVEETYEEFRKRGIGRLEFPFAQRYFKNRLSEEMKKPETLVHFMTEGALTNRDTKQALASLDRVKGLSRSSVNAAILEEFPKFREMVKVVVTSDKDALNADCVITDFTEIAKCR